MTDHIMTSQGMTDAGEVWRCETCSRVFILILADDGRRHRQIDITPGDTTVYHVCAQGVPGSAELDIGVDEGPALPDDLQDQIDKLLGGIDL